MAALVAGVGGWGEWHWAVPFMGKKPNRLKLTHLSIKYQVRNEGRSETLL